MFDYNDERLDAYATTTVQLETLNAYREHGTINKAAEALGKNTNSVNQTLYQLQLCHLIGRLQQVRRHNVETQLLFS